MNRNADYDQLIRGPQPSGSFMGGLSSKLPMREYPVIYAWDSDSDNVIVAWAKDYIHWLQANTYARTARTKDRCVALSAVAISAHGVLSPVITSLSFMLNYRHSRCSLRMRKELGSR